MTRRNDVRDDSLSVSVDGLGAEWPSCIYCGRPLPVSGYWGFDVCEDAPDGAHATSLDNKP